jgi:hypothetical protein
MTIDLSSPQASLPHSTSINNCLLDIFLYAWLGMSGLSGWAWPHLVNKPKRDEPSKSASSRRQVDESIEYPDPPTSTPEPTSRRNQLSTERVSEGSSDLEQRPQSSSVNPAANRAPSSKSSETREPVSIRPKRPSLQSWAALPTLEYPPLPASRPVSPSAQSEPPDPVHHPISPLPQITITRPSIVSNPTNNSSYEMAPPSAQPPKRSPSALISQLSEVFEPTASAPIIDGTTNSPPSQVPTTIGDDTASATNFSISNTRGDSETQKLLPSNADAAFGKLFLGAGKKKKKVARSDRPNKKNRRIRKVRKLVLRTPVLVVLVGRQVTAIVKPALQLAARGENVLEMELPKGRPSLGTGVLNGGGGS